MRKGIENLRDLFLEQGRELYDASRMAQEELPRIQKSVQNRELKTIMDREIEAAKDQGRRLEMAFKELNENPKGETSECCRSIFTATRNLIERSEDAHVRDAAIINSIQRLNHNKITGLGSLTSYARLIGHEQVARSLHESLDAEKAIDHKLSELAEREVNRLAFEPELI